MKSLSRRDLLKIGAIAGGSLILPIALQYRGLTQEALSPQVIPFSLPFQVPPVLEPVRSDSTTDYYEIVMQKANVEILPGQQTEIWGYNGIFPGPTIRQPLERSSIVRFINELDTPTTIHLHGVSSLPQFNGHPEDLIPPGYYKNYNYPNLDSRTSWYHDHTIHKTAFNIYKGLAGFYIVEDDPALNLPLPKGEYDVPLMLTDKIFAPDGSVVYDDQGQYSLMGDVITVNGVPWPRMEVANRKYRFRMLNASSSRSYLPYLSTGDNLIVISTDSSLVSEPVAVKDFRIGTAERYEFIIDFSKYPIGTQVMLLNGSLPNNQSFEHTDKIMLFDVVRSESDDSSIPTKLVEIPPVDEVVAQAVRTREFHFERFNDKWVINGKGWESDRIDANPQLGDYEIWSLNNVHDTWFHPIHIHLADFQIIDRNRKPPFVYERGWKDTVYVGENENVRVVARFRPFTGRYVFHCHNSVHEDHDMMSQFEIGQGGPSPFSAPAQPLPAPPL